MRNSKAAHCPIPFSLYDDQKNVWPTVSHQRTFMDPYIGENEPDHYDQQDHTGYIPSIRNVPCIQFDIDEEIFSS